ncbi:MAG: hypothetical protein NT062_27945, partial [Proteobacteria bacterium]|nr:hypothetical protein [Pseudomonadota bacterium]
RLFHASGNLAAEGNFAHGDRAGEWRFYDDTPAKTPIAIGKFGRRGAVVGKWRHFDATGALVATTWSETPDQWTDKSWDVDGGEGFVLVGAPRPGQVAHASHRGTVYSNPQALDTFALGDERIYVHQAFERETMYDQDGFRLEHTEAGWRASDCHWSAKRKQYAHAGDVAPLHGVLYGEAHRRVQPADEDVGGGGAHDEHGPRCGAPVAVSAARGARLDKLLAARDQVNAVTPQIVRAAVLGEERPADELSDEDRARIARSADLSHVLEETMSTYLEWPHIDGKFIALFGTLPGRVTWNWTSGDPEDGDE